jgi:adenylylsulfate kinase-like enzyme
MYRTRKALVLIAAGAGMAAVLNAPLAPELVVDSAAKRPDELAAEVIAWLEQNGKIASR